MMTVGHNLDFHCFRQLNCISQSNLDGQYLIYSCLSTLNVVTEGAAITDFCSIEK